LLPRLWPAVLTLGWILLVIAAGQGVMALASLAAGDGHARVFAITAALTAMVAMGCILTTKGRPFELNFRDAALLTATAWVIVPAFAALPFIAEPVGLPAVDAYFEMVSGITTTGSTVMTGLDTTPSSVLLWRSTVQWIGGIGIIGVAIVILPFLNIGGMQLFRLESSDRSEKSMPRVRGIATAVGQIYLVLTFVCFVIYWLLGMSAFDALNHAFTTLPTAGFSTHDASFGYFDSPAIEWAGVVFMISGALPFLAYIRLVRGRTLGERLDPQVIVLIATLVALVFLFSLWLHVEHGVDAGTALTKSAFNIVSIVTTTGYASTDYLVWGSFATTFFFVIMFVGGCTGSTSGSLKIFRYQVMYGMIVQHVRRIVHPNVVTPIRFGARTVTDDQVASVGTFVFLVFLSFTVTALVLASLGLDAETSLSAAATAISNVGPGIGPVVGPAGNFASLPDSAKLVLCLAMIMGRLEILGVLVLFLPSFYR
jgi:trk system potassium uptake protein TrkH